MNKKVLIIVAVVLIIAIIGIVVYIATSSSKPAASTTAQKPAASTTAQKPAPTTIVVGPREIDVGKANSWEFETSPSLPTSGEVRYTMDMELKIKNLSESCIFENVGRHPSLFVYPSNDRRLHFVHQPQGAGFGPVSQQQFTPDTYFRFTVVCEGNKMTMYRNGIKYKV